MNKCEINRWVNNCKNWGSFYVPAGQEGTRKRKGYTWTLCCFSNDVILREESISTGSSTTGTTTLWAYTEVLNECLSNEWVMNWNTLGVANMVPLCFSPWFHLLARFCWGRKGREGRREERGEGENQTGLVSDASSHVLRLNLFFTSVLWVQEFRGGWEWGDKWGDANRW